VRDAQGNTLAVYGNKDGGTPIYWKEQHLYGSSRLGIWNADMELSGGNSSTKWQELGNKSYELSNHLGNVLVTISDKPVDVVSNGVIDHYEAEVLSAQDYYPFGMLQPDRKWSLGSYRYGFNGKENDNEVKGEGNQQDYGMRIYDPRVGKFLSVDPLKKQYPELTPYQFASNRPIDGIDLDGLEYYYAADGYYLGRGGDPNNKEVRLATATEVYTSTGKQIVRAVNLNCENVKDWILISKDHDLFQQFAAFGYNENTVNAESQHATQNVIMNRAKGNQDKISSVMGQMAGSGIGGTHEKRMHNKWFVSYAEYINTSIDDRSNNYRMRSATMGAIQTMLGKDITGGATYEKGLDFFSSKLRSDGTNWPDYIDFRDNGMKWDTNGTFNGTYGPNKLKDHKGVFSKDFKYIGTSSYGGNTFLIDNPDYGKTKPKDENSTTPPTP
jgi:RHS repeat-associated protein